MDLKQIEELMVLMTKHKIDQIEVEGMKLVKSKHEMPAQNKDNSSFNKRVNLSDEELLFYSTTPSLTLKDIEDLEAGKLVINPTNKG